MPAEAPPTSLPPTPASAPDQTGAPSLASVAVPMLQALASALGLTPEVIATDAGKFLGEVLRPIVRQEIQDAFQAFKSTAEIGGANAELDKDWSRAFPDDRA